MTAPGRAWPKSARYGCAPTRCRGSERTVRFFSVPARRVGRDADVVRAELAQRRDQYAATVWSDDHAAGQAPPARHAGRHPAQLRLRYVGARAGARLRWPRRDAAKRLGHDRARRRPGLEARVALALVTMRCGDRELPLDLPVEPTAAPASLSAAGRNEAGDEHLHLLGDVTPRAQAQRSPRRAASGAPRGGRRSLEGPAHLASGPRTP
jgi:hypothetical protein